MTELGLRYEACVRSLSVAATCTRCQDVCPEGAITTDGRRGSVRVSLERCTGCGVCVAECPTDAFDLPLPLGTHLAGEDPRRFACGASGIPCVGAIAVEDWVALAAAGASPDVIDVGSCPARDPGHARAADRIAEANRLAEALGLRGRITWRPAEDHAPPAPVATKGEPNPAPAAAETVSAGRRQLLRLVVPTLEARAPSHLEAPARLDRARMQQVPARRRRLLAALPSGVEARLATLDGETVSVTSSKRLSTETCTACSVCFSSCPTGALGAPRTLREIRFDASRCTKCGLCHDVCEPGALTLADQVSLAELLELAPRSLGRLPVGSCVECGARFVRRDPAEGLCPRCAELEAEARDLWGMDR